MIRFRLLPLCAALGLTAFGTAAALAQTPMPTDGAASATMPAQKKPAKPGAQSGAASGPGAGSGTSVEGTGAGTAPADKKPAKPGAQSGAQPK